METIPIAALLADLACPACGAANLAQAGEAVSCGACARRYPVRRGVVDFLLQDRLGETEQREIKAMTLDIDDERKLRWVIEKEKWDRIQTHFLTRGVSAAARYLAAYARPGVTLVTLGTGSGIELRLLTRTLSFERVIGSDISWTAAYAAGRSLAEGTAAVGLLACTFDGCPLRRSANTVGFVFEALHHADDVHRTIEALLTRNFENLVFVEPTRNRLINALARRGLAMNVEYSGLKPDWIDLATVREIADRCGCDMQVTTWWPFPDSLVPKLVKRSRLLSAVLCRSVDLVSALTAPFGFGAMSAVHLRRRPGRR